MARLVVVLAVLGGDRREISYTLSMPVLLLVGSQDEKFSHIASEMKSAIGANANLMAIDKTGHSVHLEQPHRFQSVASEFLS